VLNPKTKIGGHLVDHTSGAPSCEHKLPEKPAVIMGTLRSQVLPAGSSRAHRVIGASRTVVFSVVFSSTSTRRRGRKPPRSASRFAPANRLVPESSIPTRIPEPDALDFRAPSRSVTSPRAIFGIDPWDWVLSIDDPASFAPVMPSARGSFAAPVARFGVAECLFRTLNVQSKYFPERIASGISLRAAKGPARLISAVLASLWRQPAKRGLRPCLRSGRSPPHAFPAKSFRFRSKTARA